MGVKDLWNILSPLCERKPLFELQGKAIAIDLSCWVVDSQSVTDNMAQPKMYLRNLYFRTAYLLVQGISPVFVLEGTAPTLKHKTIAKRNDIRNGSRERKNTRKGERSQFNRILSECKKLLQYMGLACVQSHGEAEAMCAYLNQDGLVEGCISQDSDCFLYGAKVVYRNFCTSTQGNRGGSNGAVDEYNMEKIERLLKIGRHKMIALALLCGCDYDNGINGVGKEAALKLFKLVEENEILERIKRWRYDTSFRQTEKLLSDPNICTSCGHEGKVQKHTRSGCNDCGTKLKCSDSYKEKRMLLLNEVALRKKALLIEDFPNQELIEEFLVRKSPVPSKLDLQWKQPQINEFIHFVEKHLSWEPQYAFEKIFPLATRWQLIYLQDISPDSRLTIANLFVPDKIRKIRNIKSVASYEILWQRENTIAERLELFYMSDEDNNEDDHIVKELVTIEPQHAVSKCYPDLVAAFECTRNAKAKKRPAKPRAKKITKCSDENGTCTTEKPKRNTRKANKKNIEVKSNRKIDEFTARNDVLALEESFEKMSITPKRSKHDQPVNRQNTLNIKENYTPACPVNERLKRGPQFDRLLETGKNTGRLNNTLGRMFNELSPDDFISDNEETDFNMSLIIENLCSKERHHFDFANVQPPLIKAQLLRDPLVEKNNATEDVKLNLEQCTEKCNTSQQKACNDTVDEFDNLDESYVPINQRLQKGVLKMGQFGITSKRPTRGQLSFGFDELMNDTNEEYQT